MMLNDKIDINNESEQVQKQRITNIKKNDDVNKKERKGFCTSCSIF
jgi:hypothetical protein